MDYAENTARLLFRGLFTDTLPSNGRPIVKRVDFRGNVFTESLPSNGSISHNIFDLIDVFVAGNTVRIYAQISRDLCMVQFDMLTPLH
jgi:hypothetical protein